MSDDPKSSEKVSLETILSFQTELKQRALFWTRNEWDADDLVQATILRAMERLHQLRDPENVKAWTMRILTNLYWEFVRRAASWETAEGEYRIRWACEHSADKEEFKELHEWRDQEEDRRELLYWLHTNLPARLAAFFDEGMSKCWHVGLEMAAMGYSRDKMRREFQRFRKWVRENMPKELMKKFLDETRYRDLV